MVHLEGAVVGCGGVLTGSTAPEHDDGSECDIQVPLEQPWPTCVNTSRL